VAAARRHAAGRREQDGLQGSAACTDNAGTLYATKGNNTTSFYKYSAVKDSWYQLASVPLGTFNKKVKGGTSAAYVAQGAAGYVYLLKGYKNEFYQYRPAADSWFRLTDAPQGSNIKWDNGSFLVYDGDRTIYAHKAKYHELYAYDVIKDSWIGPTRKAMPIVGRMGKTRKARTAPARRGSVTPSTPSRAPTRRSSGATCRPATRGPRWKRYRRLASPVPRSA